MDRISIILPSYERPTLLIGALQNIESQISSDYEIEVVVVVDDDIDGFDVSSNYFDKTDKVLGITIGRKQKYSHIAAWNLGLANASGNLFVHMGDDGRFHGNALQLAYNTHKDKLSGYGMVAFNDLNMNGDTQVGTHVFFDKQFCKDVLGGVMCVPHYKGYCVDLEFNERARGAGKYVWCQQAVLEHLHSSNGKRELFEDEMTRTQYSPEDTALFERRKTLGFPNDFEPVI